MDERLAEDEIAELERLEREATPAPWRLTHVGGGRDAYVIRPDGAPRTVTWGEGMEWASLDGRPRAHADGALLCAARNALPSLLSEVRESRRALSASPPPETRGATSDCAAREPGFPAAWCHRPIGHPGNHEYVFSTTCGPYRAPSPPSSAPPGTDAGAPTPTDKET